MRDLGGKCSGGHRLRVNKFGACEECGATARESCGRPDVPLPSSDKPSDAELVFRLGKLAAHITKQDSASPEAELMRLAASRLSVPREGAIADITAERERQKIEEGWTAEHDDEEHAEGGLAIAAGCYAIHAGGRMDMTKVPSDGRGFYTVPRGWPWAPFWWKPTNPRRELVKAGALIVAEIERLDRAAAPLPKSPA